MAQLLDQCTARVSNFSLVISQLVMAPRRITIGAPIITIAAAVFLVVIIVVIVAVVQVG